MSYKQLAKRVAPLADIFAVPLVYPAAWLLKQVRHAGVHRMRLSRAALRQVGVFPVRDHYYEPQFDFRDGADSARAERELPGVDLNAEGQLELLGRFVWAEELLEPEPGIPGVPEYRYDNDNFDAGDAEYWYQLVRLLKPRRIIEVGSGYSTLMARRAVRRNRADDPDYDCAHICIEPYEMPWLESTGVTVLRQRVEETDPALYVELGAGDILFIDSSHTIRPEGDVLFEYLRVLPTLAPGVVVHLHDIFTPRNYPDAWVREEVRFWNEQYLLEAFLTHNSAWKVIGALNFLRHRHYDALKSVCPFLTPGNEPASFYIQRVA